MPNPKYRYDTEEGERFLVSLKNPYNERLDLYWLVGTDSFFFVNRRGVIKVNEEKQVWSISRGKERGLFDVLWDGAVAAVEKVRDPSVSPNA